MTKITIILNQNNNILNAKACAELLKIHLDKNN
jgi:hypothetical protein